MCIRQEKGFCCVEFSVCPDELATLPGGSDAAPAGFSFDTSLSPARAKVDHGCRSTENSIDYISIPESGEMKNVEEMQYCSTCFEVLL